MFAKALDELGKHADAVLAQARTSSWALNVALPDKHELIALRCAAFLRRAF